MKPAGPMKNASCPNALMMVTKNPILKPNKIKAMIIGISQTRKYWPGQKKVGIRIKFKDIASAEKVIISARALLFSINLSVSIFYQLS